MDVAVVAAVAAEGLEGFRVLFVDVHEVLGEVFHAGEFLRT